MIFLDVYFCGKGFFCLENFICRRYWVGFNDGIINFDNFGLVMLIVF